MSQQKQIVKNFILQYNNNKLIYYGIGGIKMGSALSITNLIGIVYKIIEPILLAIILVLSIRVLIKADRYLNKLLNKQRT